MMRLTVQISAVTLCLEDEDISIRDLAQLFFAELSRKVNNPIYNALPDIISRWLQSTGPCPVLLPLCRAKAQMEAEEAKDDNRSRITRIAVQTCWISTQIYSAA